MVWPNDMMRKSKLSRVKVCSNTLLKGLGLPGLSGVMQTLFRGLGGFVQSIFEQEIQNS